MDDEPDEVFARRLLVCQKVEYDLRNPAAPYSARGIVTGFPPVPHEPYSVTQLWVYAEVFGVAGVHDLWVDWVRSDAEVWEDTADPTVYGPYPLRLQGDEFVRGVGLMLRYVPYRGPGRYEVRLRRGDEVLATDEVFWEG